MSSSLVGRLHGIFTKTVKPKLKPTTSTIPQISPPSTTKANPETPIKGKVSSLVKQFKKNSRSDRFRHHQSTYEATVRRLAAGKHFSAIESILEHQKKYKDSISDEGFAIRLISLYGKARMYHQARKLFDDLPSLGCNRTVNSFNALLYACINSKKYDEISEIFKEIPEILSIEPDTVSYNTVIKAFCEMGALDSAITVLNEMEKNGWEPDLITYNTILDAYYKSKRVSEAETLWGLMKDKNVIANGRSYNAKLRGLVGNNRVPEAVELMKEMEEKEVKPDVFSYNAVIKGFADDKNLEEVKKFYQKMVDNGCVPDYVTFGMLIPIAYENGDLSYALELCKRVIDLKIYIYRFRMAMQKVVDGLIEKSRVDEAKELVELANSSGLHRWKLEMPVAE